MDTATGKPPPKNRPTSQSTKKQNDTTLIVVLTATPIIMLIGFGILKPLGAFNTNDWTAAFSGLLLISTTAQAVYAKWQRDVMESQLELANETVEQTKVAARAAQVSAEAAQATVEYMRLEQRPWLSAGIASIDQPFVVGERVKFTVQMRNDGNTPGWIVKTRITNYVDPKATRMEDLIANFEAQSLESVEELAIPPRSVIPLHVKDTFHIMDQQLIDDVTHGGRILHVFGNMVYRDIWGGEYPLKFCFVWQHDTSPPGLYMDFRYTVIK